MQEVTRKITCSKAVARKPDGASAPRRNLMLQLDEDTVLSNLPAPPTGARCLMMTHCTLIDHPLDEFSHLLL
jgi:hypothetical protein